jgi:thymidine kinase
MQIPPLVEVGELHLILGNMRSGKSSHLINNLLRYKAIGHNIFCINSINDTRTPNNEIKTHDLVTIPAIKCKNLKIDIPYNTTVIGIDEAQFFDDLIPFIKYMLEKKMIIIVAGLDSDYKQEPFGEILKLIPIADTYKKVYSFCKICKNGTLGSFTKRINTNNKEKILVGDDYYISVCRKCLY